MSVASTVRVVVVGVMLGVIAFCFAAPTVNGQQPEGAVSVDVVDAATGAPVADASVSLNSGGVLWLLPQQTDGTHLADSVPAGPATVTVTAFPLYTSNTGVSRDVTVVAGETLLVTVELDAQSTGAIRVSVVDAATGASVADASVSLNAGGVSWPMLPQQADGTYLAEPVPAGPATVSVTALPVYSVNGLSRDVTVVAGETLLVTIELDAAAGAVVEPTTAPPSGAALPATGLTGRAVGLLTLVAMALLASGTAALLFARHRPIRN